ncbi:MULTISPECIES: hypothetical protein [Nocardioides]|uniref:DUF4267 domain-containing protein n=1 Tax=Nocardioides vastitatis TaxID=2568655 RepID=A0ABW0ZFV5_9ACTN|nr:hypothetical protein [Nocardioides sp.]THI91119.1 hypothetical protein E7Z54_22515 [Nocardioides sp.]
MDPVTGISLGRIAIGVGALAAPTPTARLFGLAPAENPQLGYFGRMFGAREIALGAITLLSKGALRRNLTIVGMAVDGADAATGALELRGGRVPKVAGAMLIGGALGAVGSGVAGLFLNRG